MKQIPYERQSISKIDSNEVLNQDKYVSGYIDFLG